MNKDGLLKQINTQVSKRLNGTVSIGDIGADLIHGFPGISVSLKNVVIRDSSYSAHHHDLLNAGRVYVSLNVISVIKGAPHISYVSFNKGSVYIFTDSTGYSNASVFDKKQKEDSTSGDVDLELNHIFLNDVNVTYENKNKFKLFRMDIDKMESILAYNDTGWTAQLNIKTIAKDFAFNTEKGSFIKNKKLAIDIVVGYNKNKQLLTVPRQIIGVGDDDVYVTGSFMLEKKPASFILEFETNNILVAHAKSMVSTSISSKLKIIDLKKPIDIYVHLQGLLKYRDTPDVYLTWVVKDNVLVTPVAEIQDCSFSGLYMNQLIPGNGHDDKNSRINLFGLKGSWQKIPFRADTIQVANLIKPVIEGQFLSDFSLSKLNPVLGGNTFLFNAGNAKLNLLYKGGLTPDDNTPPYVYGSIQVSNGEMTYLPRSLSFSNVNATINFKGSDVFIQNVNIKNGTTTLKMDGSVQNFLNLYYSDPTKILFDWNIRSKKIDLNDYRVFLTRRGTGDAAKAGEPSKSNVAVSKMSKQLDKMLDVSTVRMKIRVNEVLYKSFSAKDFNADIRLGQSGIGLENISLNHAGGKLELQGNLDQKGAINNFHVISNVQNVHIGPFFKAFANFGQDAITDKNLQGRLFANIDMSGSIRDNGDLLPKSFDGTVDFDLQDGALVNFEPFKRIGKFIFRRRNLENVTIRNLKNRLEIKGNKFIIKNMLLETSALNMQIRGVYSLSTGTDIDLDIPLRNPKKDELILDDSLKLDRSMKGIVIHLKGVDGEDGNVKFKLMTKKQERN